MRTVEIPRGDLTAISADVDSLLAERDRLRAILQTITDHAAETYPHFESERGQREIAEARAALSASAEKE